LPKPVLGGVPQSVELHLFDKSGLSDGRGEMKGVDKKEEDKGKKHKGQKEKEKEKEAQD
jgi:hypothetical protein